MHVQESFFWMIGLDLLCKNFSLLEFLSRNICLFCKIGVFAFSCSEFFIKLLHIYIYIVFDNENGTTYFSFETSNI